MKIYKFPEPHKVEDAKQEYRKPAGISKDEIAERIKEYTSKMHTTTQQIAFVTRHMRVIGISSISELWRLQRDLEYYGAKLYELRKQQEHGYVNSP